MADVFIYPNRLEQENYGIDIVAFDCNGERSFGGNENSDADEVYRACVSVGLGAVSIGTISPQEFTDLAQARPAVTTQEEVPNVDISVFTKLNQDAKNQRRRSLFEAAMSGAITTPQVFEEEALTARVASNHNVVILDNRGITQGVIREGRWDNADGYFGPLEIDPELLDDLRNSGKIDDELHDYIKENCTHEAFQHELVESVAHGSTEDDAHRYTDLLTLQGHSSFGNMVDGTYQPFLTLVSGRNIY